MTAYVLVIVLAAGGHHQSSQSAIPTKGRALLRPNGYGATKRLMANA
jgi:hypothetical protein